MKAITIPKWLKIFAIVGLIVCVAILVIAGATQEEINGITALVIGVIIAVGLLIKGAVELINRILVKKE